MIHDKRHSVLISVSAAIAFMCIPLKADELSGSGLGSLKRGGALYTLAQITENATNEKQFGSAYRVISASGFSLEDIVIIEYDGGGGRVFWREGLYRDVNFGGFEYGDGSRGGGERGSRLNELLTLLKEPQVWKFDQAFTGQAVEDGPKIMIAKLDENGKVSFRAHRGNGIDQFANLRNAQELTQNLWKIVK